MTRHLDSTDNGEHKQYYTIAVMKVQAGEKVSRDFDTLVEGAQADMEAQLGEEAGNLKFEIFDFSGPHLTPSEGTYSALDFLRLGMTEKLERHIQFLLIVTDVDLSAQVHSYVLALPSQITNVAIISTKRVSPEFWGNEADPAVAKQRLSSLMLHSFGHLLKLPHSPDRTNIMWDFKGVEDLEQMTELSAEQLAHLKRNLPDEAREKVSEENHWRFTLHQIVENRGAIWDATWRANPFRIIARLPTMLTAAFSILIAAFFTPDSWDAVGAISVVALAALSVLAIVGATVAMYSAFHIGPGSIRKKVVSESTVVTATATLLTLLVTVLLLYLLFFLVAAGSAFLFLPPEVTQEWGVIDLGIPVPEQAQLGMFLGALGVVGGSLGAKADSKEVVRSVLFLDEET